MSTTYAVHTKSSPESPTYVKSSYQAPHYTSSVESARTALSTNSNDILVGEQWLVLGRIGEGSFGEVFEARDIDTNRSYAIKREPKSMRHPQLKHESIMYDALVGGPGIPACHWYGEHDDFNCIVIDLLGPSLKLLRQAVSDFTLDVALNIACQLINTIEHIHSRGIIYRDIKPDNFLFPASFRLPDPECFETQTDNGFMVYEATRPSCKVLFEEQDPSASKIFAIDFGLASWWRNPSTNKPYPEGKRRIRNKTGTARYASLNVHRGKEHSRRDDMESIGYLLIDLALGSLPWTGIQARNSRLGWDKMREAKEMIMLQDLCAGLPLAFLKYIEYARALKFDDEPDYGYLRSLFEGAKEDGPYSEHVIPFDRSYLRGNDVEVLSTVSDQGTTAKMTNSDKQQAWSDVEQYKSQSVATTRDNDGIFAMDDIIPHEEDRTKRERHEPRNARQRHREPSNSSYKKLLQQTRDRRSNVGWNTHKRLQQPWEPKIDWETIPSADKTSTSWGEDRPNGMWSKSSNADKQGWPERDAIADSWTAKHDGWGATTWESGVERPEVDGAGKKQNGSTSLRDAVHAQPWVPSSMESEVSGVAHKLANHTIMDKEDDRRSGRRVYGKMNSHPRLDTDKKGERRHSTTVSIKTNKGGENWSPEIGQKPEDWQPVGRQPPRKPFKPKTRTGGYSEKNHPKGSSMKDLHHAKK
ncbi:kinase-like domain-containing protein [Umbelopsis sp. AD052]|nr:kinase-like domain-containing protein [Umbelopsis sp. AD052]